jgi:hypothetical protein
MRVRACGIYVTEENTYTILVGKPEIKRPLGRPMQIIPK